MTLRFFLVLYLVNKCTFPLIGCDLGNKKKWYLKYKKCWDLNGSFIQEWSLTGVGCRRNAFILNWGEANTAPLPLKGLSYQEVVERRLLHLKIPLKLIIFPAYKNTFYFKSVDIENCLNINYLFFWISISWFVIFIHPRPLSQKNEKSSL